MGKFQSEEAAFARVAHIRRDFGAWPGVINRGDGTYDLTFEPETFIARHDRTLGDLLTEAARKAKL